MVYTNDYGKHAFSVIVKNENNKVVYAYGPYTTKESAEDIVKLCLSMSNIARRAQRHETANEHFEVVPFNEIPSDVTVTMI